MTTAPHPSFWDTLWNSAKAEVAKLEADTAAEAKVLFAEVKTDVNALWTAGMPIAIQAVLAEAKSVASGNEKFSTAVVKVMQELESNPAIGPVAIQDVYAIVQEAYRWLPLLLSAL